MQNQTGKRPAILSRFGWPGWLPRPKPVDLFFLLGLTIVFFTLPMLTGPDSESYILNASVLAGELPFSEWNTVRGPLLPFLLRLGFALFGETSFGGLVLYYLIYLTLIAATLYLAHLLGVVKRLGRTFTWLVLSFLIFLNPMLLTYSHYVFTEFPALLLAVLAACLVVKTQQLLCAGPRRWFVLLARYGGVFLLAAAAYALKQMFFVTVLAPFLISEAYLLIGRWGVKQLAISLTGLVLAVAAVPLWSVGWQAYLAPRVTVDETYTAGSMASSTLVDAMRYFRIEGLYATGEELTVEVMSNDYTEVLDTFTYTFDGSFADSLRFLGTCLTTSPSRFFTSYIHNYLVISNVRRILNYTHIRMYFPVSITNHFTMSFENQAWLESFKWMEKGDVHTPYSEIGAQFAVPLDNGLVSNLLYNTRYPELSYFLYSFPCFIAPFAFLLGAAMSIVRRKKEQLLRYWGFVTLLSGTIFGHILFLTVTASSIDRYGFPISIHAVLLLVLCVGGLAGFARRAVLFVQKRRRAAK